MSENVMVLCDREEEYAQLMSEFLREHKGLPWEIHTYTDVGQLYQAERGHAISLLVVAESTFDEGMKDLDVGRLVLLNESGLLRWEELEQVDKYQQADKVLHALLEIYMEVEQQQLPRLQTQMKARFIGVYSPVRRCFQTTFSLTMSQLLARDHRTLYLNFEHFAGIPELLPHMQTRDLADLLYFLGAEQEKFRLRMQTMIQQMGSLDYIPPMKSGQNLLTITGKEWMHLLQRIDEMGQYEYVVLDLSESMQGLFDILRMCSQVVTLTREDKVAQSKLMQYEQVLGLYEYEDVLRKTHKYAPPILRKLPAELEQYTKGEMAEFVQKRIVEMGLE